MLQDGLADTGLLEKAHLSQEPGIAHLPSEDLHNNR